MYDLIIIGADSAGLSAGIYAGRKKLNAIILTEKIGGQSLYAASIENYPGFLNISGVDLVSKLKEQVQKFGVSINDGEKVLSVKKDNDVFIVETKKNKYEARAVIIATGSRWRALNIPGENEFIGRGVSFCAICDAPFYFGKDVAVVGGGNSAFDSAYDLLKYANKIYLLQRGEKFKGDEAMYNKLKKSGKVEFLTNAETKEIRGNKFVEKIIYEDKKTGQTKELNVGGVFINIGQIPNSIFVEGFLELNERKEIIIDCKSNAASVEGVFAAGDATNVKYKQAIIAAAEGAKAALSAYEYLVCQ
ncbi:FAD-dependent oxidoreductase [Patescibacteria group bacterium]|nr:FAD-dependent oxidoreductase [Patescibacteria group bacterium]